MRTLRVVWLVIAMCAALGAFANAQAAGSDPTRSQSQPALSPAAPESVGMSSARLKKVSAYFQREIDNGKLPGAVIAIARQGRLVYFEALGKRDPAAGQPMTRDTIFRLYSMTKPLASVAAMILVEDGLLQLTDPVSKFLPEFREPKVAVPRTDEKGNTSYEMVPADRPILVHDLLRHSSGLAYGEITKNAAVRQAYAEAGLAKPGRIDFDARDMTSAEQVSRLAKAPLAQQPGAVFEYSLSTDLLGRVVEAASGKRLGELLDERLFKPLSMADTGFWVSGGAIARLAQPFANDPFGGAPIKLIDVTAPPGNDSGGAGAVGTAADYLRFAQMLLEGGSLDGRQILSPMTVALMTADHQGSRPGPYGMPGELLLGTQGYKFGLGFMVREAQGLAGVHGSPGEFMWAGYAGTFFWVDPRERLAVVLMAQQPGASRTHYRRAIKTLVAQAVVAPPTHASSEGALSVARQAP